MTICFKRPRLTILLFTVVLIGFARVAHAQDPCSFPVLLNGTAFQTNDWPNHVAVGDLNNDGKRDVVTANFGSNDISVLLGTGTGSFQAAINNPADMRPTFVALKDFSSDGVLDVVVLNPTISKITILIGNGNGNFTQLAQYSIYNPLNVQTSDVNNDGKWDLVVIAGDGVVGKVSVYLGIGNGTFSAPIDTELPNGISSSLAVGDFNGDGFTDVAANLTGGRQGIRIWNGNGSGAFTLGWTTNQGAGFIYSGNFNGDNKTDLVLIDTGMRVFAGIGNGSFQMLQQYSVGEVATFAAIADINNDGLDDVISSDFASNEMSILVATGNGTFSSTLNQSTSGEPTGIVVADFNGDNKPDVVTSSMRNDLIMLTLGRGDGTFIAPVNYPIFANSFPNSAAIADINADGKDDVIVANSQGWGLSVFLRIGNFKFASQLKLLESTYVYFVTIADFNRDSKVDIFAVGGTVGTMLFGNGTGGFTVAGSFSVLPSGGAAVHVGSADFNADGKLDIVVADRDGGRIVVFNGNGDGTFGSTPVTYDFGGPTPKRVAIGDLNNDSKPDLVIALDTGSTIFGRVQVRLNQANGTFPTGSDYIVGVSIHPSSVIASDLNGDGNLDFAVTTETDATLAGQVRVYAGNGSGTFTGPSSFNVSGVNPYDLVAKDFNLDGKIDIAAVNYSSEDVSVFAGTGGGGFSLTQSISTGEQPRTITVGNLNADSSPDLVATNYNAGTFTIMPNGCHQAIEPTIGRLFDFDGDGKSDVSVFRPSSGNWFIQNSGNGSYNFQLFGVTGDMITPADFDGDGKTDIAVWRPSNGAWYRLNSSNGTFTAEIFGANGDFPVPADYEGDGKADVCVFRPSDGSWYRINSSNGQFVAIGFGVSEDKPAVGDFDGDGRADISLFRPSVGTWFRLNSTNGLFVSTQFGAPADKPAPADFDGDGKTDISVYRPSSGNWYRLNSSDSTFFAIQFGTSGDKPSAADFDGDGKSDIAVYRPSNGVWYILKSSAGFSAQQFGISEDLPAPNAFVY